ncbi:MAG: YHS domain-containing protein [Planctomycetes bacterium]|nr:YHS domain-containing protein [Planctomycetota bacterium]
MEKVVRVLCVALVLAAACLVAGCGQEGANQPAAGGKAQALCPVMGQKINKAIFADHEGKRVYFCCEGCPETFKKDPAKYIKKLEDEGVVLEKTPSKGG